METAVTVIWALVQLGTLYFAVLAIIRSRGGVALAKYRGNGARLMLALSRQRLFTALGVMLVMFTLAAPFALLDLAWLARLALVGGAVALLFGMRRLERDTEAIDRYLEDVKHDA